MNYYYMKSTVGLGQDFQKKEKAFLDQYEIKIKQGFDDLHHNTCTLTYPNDKN